MSITQELKIRREGLISKIARLWDELIEVDEHISVTEAVGKNIQNEQPHISINLREMEISLRDAALRRAGTVLSETLSNLDEVRPECPNCGEIMKKKINEPSK